MDSHADLCIFRRSVLKNVSLSRLIFPFWGTKKAQDSSFLRLAMLFEKSSGNFAGRFLRHLPITAHLTGEAAQARPFQTQQAIHFVGGIFVAGPG